MANTTFTTRTDMYGKLEEIRIDPDGTITVLKTINTIESTINESTVDEEVKVLLKKLFRVRYGIMNEGMNY